MNNPNNSHSTLQIRITNEQIIKDHEEAKRLQERYVILKRRIETCREVKNSEAESIKDRRAISYFETCQGQIQIKLDQHDENFKKVVEQMENSKKILEDKLLFVNQRLSQAKERIENQLHHKTKEEIAVEKEIKDMLSQYSGLQPTSDLNIAFPDYRKLLNLPEPIPPQPVYSAPTNIPSQTPSTAYLKAKIEKRKAKQVEVREPPVLPDLVPEPKPETNPLAMMSNKDIEKLSQAEMWNLIHPGKPNPYENIEEEEQEEQPEEEEEEEPTPRYQYPKIVSNSKLPFKGKRPPKQV